MISDNVFYKGVFGQWGSYAITVIDADFSNRAIIDQGVTLDINNDVQVLASMTRDITAPTKNGFPLVDKNKGPKDAEISGNITSDAITVIATGTTTIKNAIIENLNNPRLDELKDYETLRVTSHNDISVKDSTISGVTTLIAEQGSDIEIDKVTINGDTIINSDGDTIIGDTGLNIDGILINQSKNTTVTGNLNVTKDANIIATDSIYIADGRMGNDINLDAQNVKIDNIRVGQFINVIVDDIDVNTSYDLMVGIINGHGDNLYTENLKISSARNILNHMSEDDINIYAKSIDLTAGVSVGEKGLPLVMHLPEDNSISIDAQNLENIKTTGAGPNYTKYKAKDAIINAEGKLKISGLEVEPIDAKTKSKQADISGVVKSADK